MCSGKTRADGEIKSKKGEVIAEKRKDGVWKLNDGKKPRTGKKKNKDTKSSLEQLLLV